MATIVTFPKNPKINVGVQIPLSRPTGAGFNVSYSTRDQYAYNLYHLIMTEKGERIYDLDFGVTKKKWLFENFQNDSDDINDFINDDIVAAAKKYLPEVVILKTSTEKHIDEHQITLVINYSVQNVPQQLSIPIIL